LSKDKKERKSLAPSGQKDRKGRAKKREPFAMRIAVQEGESISPHTEQRKKQGKVTLSKGTMPPTSFKKRAVICVINPRRELRKSSYPLG